MPPPNHLARWPGQELLDNWAKGAVGVQRRWPTLPKSLNPGEAATGPDPSPPYLGAALTQCPPVTESHPCEILATKNTSGHSKFGMGHP